MEATPKPERTSTNPAEADNPWRFASQHTPMEGPPTRLVTPATADEEKIAIAAEKLARRRRRDIEVLGAEQREARKKALELIDELGTDGACHIHVFLGAISKDLSIAQTVFDRLWTEGELSFNDRRMIIQPRRNSTNR